MLRARSLSQVDRMAVSWGRSTLITTIHFCRQCGIDTDQNHGHRVPETMTVSFNSHACGSSDGSTDLQCFRRLHVGEAVGPHTGDVSEPRAPPGTFSRLAGADIPTALLHQASLGRDLSCSCRVPAPAGLRFSMSHSASGRRRTSSRLGRKN